MFGFTLTHVRQYLVKANVRPYKFIHSALVSMPSRSYLRPTLRFPR